MVNKKINNLKGKQSLNSSNKENFSEAHNDAHAVIKEGQDQGESQNRKDLEKKFKTGAQPTAKDFADLFSSFLNFKDDSVSPAVNTEGSGGNAIILKPIKFEKTIRYEELPISESENGFKQEEGKKVREIINFDNGNGTNRWNLNIGDENDLYICYDNRAIMSVSSKQKYVNQQIEELKDSIKNMHFSSAAYYKHTSITYNDKIYIIGGICLNTIVEKPSDMVFVYSDNVELCKLKNYRSEHASIVLQDKLYLIGGNYQEYANFIEVYELVSMKLIQRSTELSASRLGSTCESNNNVIYRIGGYSSNYYYKSIQKINDDLSLTDLCDINVISGGIAYHRSFIWKNKIYIVGGKFSDYWISETIYIVDISTKKTEISRCKKSVSHHSLVKVEYENGDQEVKCKIFVIGGLVEADPSKKTYTNEISVYSVQNDGELCEESVILSLKQPRAYHTSEVIDGKIYVMGGKIGTSERDAVPTNDIEIIDISTLLKDISPNDEGSINDVTSNMSDKSPESALEKTEHKTVRLKAPASGRRNIRGLQK